MIVSLGNFSFHSDRRVLGYHLRQVSLMEPDDFYLAGIVLDHSFGHGNFFPESLGSFQSRDLSEYYHSISLAQTSDTRHLRRVAIACGKVVEQVSGCLNP